LTGLDVESAEQVLQVRQLGLDLDHEDGFAGWVKPQQVDPAPLAILAEAGLCLQHHPGVPERAGQRVDDGGVLVIKDASDIGPSTDHAPFDAKVKGGRMLPQDVR